MFVTLRLLRGKTIGHSASSSILNDFFRIYSSIFHGIFESDVLIYACGVTRPIKIWSFASQKHLVSYPISLECRVFNLSIFVEIIIVALLIGGGAVLMSPDFVVACTKTLQNNIFRCSALNCVLCISRHDRFHLDFLSSTQPTNHPTSCIEINYCDYCSLPSNLVHTVPRAPK